MNQRYKQELADAKEVSSFSPCLFVVFINLFLADKISTKQPIF